MPIVCIQRPNRSYVRNFTAADAARIWCYAKAAGATEETFLRLVRERHCWDLPDETSWREKVQDIRARSLKGETQKQLADVFILGATVIGKITRRECRLSG